MTIVKTLPMVNGHHPYVLDKGGNGEFFAVGVLQTTETTIDDPFSPSPCVPTIEWFPARKDELNTAYWPYGVTCVLDIPEHQYNRLYKSIVM